MSASLPNLIIVMPDELRQQAVGLTKTDPVITPNLDKFSKEALNLTNAISNCPICSPARAMLFTGKFPVSNGVTDNCYSKTTEFDIQLKETDRCLSDVLQDSGYSQGYIGKFHLDSPNEKDAEYTEGWRGNPENGGTLWDAYTPPGPRRHGFNFWYSYGCCDNHLSPHYWLNDAKVNERTDVDAWSVEHETGVAIDYIRNTDNEYRDENKPFFLMVAHNPPHMPFHAVPDAVQPAPPTPEGEDFDIMRPLNVTDTCFMAVELIRDQGDVAMFKELGDQILIKDDAATGDNNKTYFGIIGKMLKENKSIREIRQTLLDTCRKLQTPTIKPAEE